MFEQLPTPAARFLETFGRFEVAADIRPFLDQTIFNEKSPLYNSEHDHLIPADIGFLWTTATARRHLRRIVAEAEIPAFRVGGFQKSRLEFQLAELFGGQVPDFVVTFDAAFRAECSDIEFLAVIEHELYHCGQAVDEFGSPRFRRDDGRPVYAIRGHDIEEFAGVIRRYGAAVAGQDRADFVAAANQDPEHNIRTITAALCGTC